MPETWPRDAVEQRVTELIGLGRDREAAILATTRRRDPRPEPVTTQAVTTQGDIMDVLRQLDLLGPTLGGVAAGITPDQLDAPTPCARFTVRGVLEHMVSGATVFAAAFRGEEAPEPDLSDPLASFGPAMGNLMDAIHAAGALERTVPTPGGDARGEDFAQFVVLDGLVHGYDLATATGQAYDPEPELVEIVTRFAEQALAGLRDGETFKEPTNPPADSTPIEGLAALTGRTVR